MESEGTRSAEVRDIPTLTLHRHAISRSHSRNASGRPLVFVAPAADASRDPSASVPTDSAVGSPGHPPGLPTFGRDVVDARRDKRLPLQKFSAAAEPGGI